MWPETVTSGFLFLASFCCFVVRQIGYSDEQLVDFLQRVAKLDAGALALVSALAIGGGYIFGNVAGRLMTDLFNCGGICCRYMCRQYHRILDDPVQTQKARMMAPDADDRRLVKLLSTRPDLLAETLHNRWRAKYFYRTMLGGIPLLAIGSSPWGLCSGIPRVSCAIWIVGSVLEVAFIVAFITQRSSEISFRRAVKSPA
jgi:hypothetical protein